MARSVLNDPKFQLLIVGIGFCLYSTFYIGLQNGGIVNGVASLFQGIYGILIATIFVGIIFVKVYHIISPYKMLIE